MHDCPAEFRAITQQRGNSGRVGGRRGRPKASGVKDPQIDPFEFFRVKFCAQQFLVNLKGRTAFCGDPRRLLTGGQKFFEEFAGKTCAANVRGGSGHGSGDPETSERSADGTFHLQFDEAIEFDCVFHG